LQLLFSKKETRAFPDADAMDKIVAAVEGK
jgi:hypothetical protein